MKLDIRLQSALECSRHRCRYGVLLGHCSLHFHSMCNLHIAINRLFSTTSFGCWTTHAFEFCFILLATAKALMTMNWRVLRNTERKTCCWHSTQRFSHVVYLLNCRNSAKMQRQQSTSCSVSTVMWALMKASATSSVQNFTMIVAKRLPTSRKDS